MTSSKQLQANKANAQRSTGPRSNAGKARSRLNSWKHGLSAQDITIVDEDPNNFEALRAELWHEFQPAIGLESILLDRLVAYAWRLRRVPGLEAYRLRDGNFDYGSGPLLSLLIRYEVGLLNAFNRTLEQLLLLQERRRSDERKGMPEVLAPAANDDAA